MKRNSKHEKEKRQMQRGQTISTKRGVVVSATRRNNKRETRNNSKRDKERSSKCDMENNKQCEERSSNYHEKEQHEAWRGIKIQHGVQIGIQAPFYSCFKVLGLGVAPPPPLNLHHKHKPFFMSISK